MKTIAGFSILTCFVLICACQKNDSAAEAQLVQRKAELDSREKALDEREKALVEREKVIARSRPLPSDLQSRKPIVDPEQANAEREKRIQQLPPELRALIPDRSQLNSAKLAKDREAAVQGPTPDPEQARAERERRIQQLPPELQALIRDRSLLDTRKDGKSATTEDPAAQLQRRLEEARRKMGAPGSPNPGAPDRHPGSPPPSPTPY